MSPVTRVGGRATWARGSRAILQNFAPPTCPETGARIHISEHEALKARFWEGQTVTECAACKGWHLKWRSGEFVK